MAIKQAKCYVEEGYTHVVDIDLAKFFDRVNHDRLMSRMAQRIEDKRVLKIIRAFLNSGVLIGDVLEEPGEGTPQGGPLSPLLANIVLDELDKELDPPSSVDYGVSKQSVADLPRRSPQGEVG
jgi:retron-type reverse transcriptase